MYTTTTSDGQTMSVFDPAERAFAEAISRIIYCNPFMPERISCERAGLGAEFVEAACDWNRRADSYGQHPNIVRLNDRAAALAESARARLAGRAGGGAEGGAGPGERDLGLYENLVHFILHHRYSERLTGLIAPAPEQPAGRQRIDFWPAFLQEASRFLEIPGVRLPGQESPAHLLACLFQIRRAFHHIFNYIVGGSPAACRLRAAAWESIFTHDLARYRRALYQRMGDITTLITGPSGTGKELVARAIGLSRYIPFDPKSQSFCAESAGSFYPLSLAALSPTLIESELFGHRRGSFTGALEDRAGWLEICPPTGAVFLDEVGEVEAHIQVKLLRVLQTRTFQRLGDTQTRPFLGKIIAATNRDLAREMSDGRFREDFYYRLCSDWVTTPSLHELLDGSEEELHGLVLFIAMRVAGDEAEALAREVEAWIEKHLGRDYRWPGNFRELEQCVRNVLVRGAYHPAAAPAGHDACGFDALSESVRAGQLTADELLDRYCTLIYARSGSYEEAARRLAMDRRTVKSKVDQAKRIRSA